MENRRAAIKQLFDGLLSFGGGGFGAVLSKVEEESVVNSEQNSLASATYRERDSADNQADDHDMRGAIEYLNSDDLFD